ncbi:MAG: glycolate oxidase subunit GlcF [Pseudomonadota bacterium]
MQTNFTPEQLQDSHVAHSEKILRTCVHCGFCTATCPTYVTLGDELDSPRGRIYLIKDMLENDRPADEKTVKHIDRCLSCLSCMTTCPSGVHYMHLVDHARMHIEKTYKRPFMDRLTRNILSTVLPYPDRFRLATNLAKLGKPFAGLMKSIPGFHRFGAMLELAPASLPAKTATMAPKAFAPKADKKGRVAILTGCAQPVLQPGINDATIDLLNRLGIEVVLPKGEGCCGALVHHMGKEEAGLAAARQNIDAWMREIDGDGLDAIIITASGCGTTIKDYGHMLREDPAYADKANRVTALAKDITEYLATIDLPTPAVAPDIKIAYHSACSMQHGQKITMQPKNLLRAAGFRVVDVPEGHLCCGSAGTYNIMQPEIAGQLRDRKIKNIKSTKPDIIATGNIGCITQIAGGMKADGADIPILHTVELLNWVYGGKEPALLKERGLDKRLKSLAEAAE